MLIYGKLCNKQFLIKACLYLQCNKVNHYKTLKLQKLNITNFNISRTLTTGKNNILLSNYYEVLNIGRTATTNEIKKAYIELTKQFHPDSMQLDNKDTDKIDQFLKIREAYDILGNPITRKNYDLEAFGRSSDLNRFSTGEYELYKEKLDKIHKENVDEKSQNGNDTKVTSLFTVSPRVRQLLNYLYGFIFASVIAMYLLGKRNKTKDDE